jgi:hypothetical protein
MMEDGCLLDEGCLDGKLFYLLISLLLLDLLSPISDCYLTSLINFFNSKFICLFFSISLSSAVLLIVSCFSSEMLSRQY